MTGRHKMEAAFSDKGSDEIPAVICYEGIYIRDHWKQLTAYPWWHQESPDIKRQMLWRRDVIEKTGQDWFSLPFFYAEEDRKHISVEERPGGVLFTDRRTGREERLSEPQVSGWPASGQIASHHPAHLAETPEEIDRLIPISPYFNPEMRIADGRGDLAARLLEEFGGEMFPICHVASPLWSCYGLWGFEGMMTMIATRPDVVEYACHRFLTLSIREVQGAAALGAAGIWIEECLTDMISPEAFAALNVPFLISLADAIRAAGMKSIYYYCGNPAGKWDLLLATDTDALSLEESKKGFTIDIEEVVDRVQGRCVVLGNLDAIGILQDGSEEQLKAEINRQIHSGRRNGSRFILSLGSPVTPETPVERVRLYCDLAHEIGKREI